jgi:hypothetical protein
MDTEYYTPDLTEISMQLAELNRTVTELRGLIVSAFANEGSEWKIFLDGEKKFLGLHGFAGGIIGGEIRGDLKGRKEGGNKGGGKGVSEPPKNPQNCERILNAPDVEYLASKCTAVIARYLNPMELERMNSSNAMKQNAGVMAKLLQAGYTNEHILQAVTDAANDPFWRKQFRSLLKLTRKNKDGVMYIDVFLALNQTNHKLPQQRKKIIV